ncbi:MAG: hypothetical protein NC489_41730 [Ruminococcus flavefaciens]|nr:hypothetical protein [Ruminococcus flavefaciens]
MEAREVIRETRLREWGEKVAECRSSGKPVRRWCEEAGIKVKTYYGWERKVLQAAGERRTAGESKPQFAALPEAGREEERAAAVRVQKGEFSMEIYEGATAELVRIVCEAVKGC